MYQPRRLNKTAVWRGMLTPLAMPLCFCGLCVCACARIAAGAPTVAGWRSDADRLLARAAGGACSEAVKNPGAGVVVIHKLEHQLPLGSVRFGRRSELEQRQCAMPPADRA
jgi:hypothetical protein